MGLFTKKEGGTVMGNLIRNATANGGQGIADFVGKVSGAVKIQPIETRSEVGLSGKTGLMILAGILFVFFCF